MKSNPQYIFILAAVLLTVEIFSRPEINIQYLDDVQIDKDVILFKDIAVINGEGIDVENLKMAKVGKPANFGLTRQLSTIPFYSKFLEALETEYQITGHEEKLIKITTCSNILPGDSVNGLIRDFITGYFAGERGEFEYEVLSMPKEIRVPSGSFNLNITAPNTYKKLGSQNLNLVIEKDKNNIRKLPLKVFIRKYDSVWVAKDKIMRGEKIKPGQWKMEYREVTRIEGESVRDILEVSEMLTKQTIIKNRILTTRLIKLEPVVKQGQHVNLLVQSSGITVLMNGVARQDGCLGQIISVKNQMSHKLVRAKILEGGKLELVSMATRR